MSDRVYVGARESAVDVSPQFDSYSKVIIHIDDENAIEYGNNTGRTLEIDNPFGTQEMAREILTRLQGLQYQPYRAEGALLDPAAEIGDAVETASSYGGVYKRSRTFGRLMKANISAPYDEEIDHEYAFESPDERKFTKVTGELRASLILTNTLIQSEVVDRQNAQNEMLSRITQNADSITAEVSRAKQAEGSLSSTLSVHAGEISAKVDARGGANASGSFSWSLTSTGHSWYANGSSTPVFRISKDGAYVNGEIRATKGKIGGFDIGTNALQYNGLTWGDTSKNYGVYIGQSGIQLGKNFSVTNSGAVTASSLSLRGTLRFLRDDGSVAGTMSAADLQKGASEAYSNYSSWNGTTSTVNKNGGYWGSGGVAGTKFDNMSTAHASYPINASSFRVNGTQLTVQTFWFIDGRGNSRSITGLFSATE